MYFNIGLTWFTQLDVSNTSNQHKKTRTHYSVLHTLAYYLVLLGVLVGVQAGHGPAVPGRLGAGLEHLLPLGFHRRLSFYFTLASLPADEIRGL